MCAIFGAKCNPLGNCIQGPITLGCEHLGGGECLNCGRGRFTSFSAFTQDAEGNQVVTSDDTTGMLLNELGWVIESPGPTSLQAGDIVVKINGHLADVDFFSSNLMDSAEQFTLKYYRAGFTGLQTIVLSRT